MLFHLDASEVGVEDEVALEAAPVEVGALGTARPGVLEPLCRLGHELPRLLLAAVLGGCQGFFFF